MSQRVHMSFVRTGILSILIVACPGSLLWGQGRLKQVDCFGMVVDGQGRPVQGAEVLCSEQLYEYAEGRINWRTPSRMTTGANGRFQLQVLAQRRNYVWVVAWKKGLSLGWQRVPESGSSQDLIVRLCEPTVLGGIVVDENGKGVSGATVRSWLKANYMGRLLDVSFPEPNEWFSIRTDDQGRFRLDRIPTGATADFWVSASGKASCWTLWEKELSDVAGSQFKAGRTDIRIALRPEAIIRGRVIDEDSGRSIAGVRLLARPNTGYANYFCAEPVISGQDGTFVYRGLAANDYSLQVVAPQDRTADWVGKDIKVIVLAGQTMDVNVPVGKGGVIEVQVQDAATGRPVENAGVNVSQPASFGLHPCWYLMMHTNAEGLVRLRVPVGECHLSMWADTYEDLDDPEPVTVAKGEVVRHQARLDASPIVTGTVRDPEGRSAVGVLVSFNAVCDEPVRTDDQGRFRVTSNDSIRGLMVLARDTARNMADLAEVKDQTQRIDVKLAPAFVVRGRISDPNGKAISMATISLLASMPSRIMDVTPIMQTDASGVYEIRAIPSPLEGLRYSLEVRAQGYGPIRLRELPFDAAKDRRIEVKTIVLAPADRSISGVVVDAHGVPVKGLPIFISGSDYSNTAGQPSQQAVSDEQGRFTVDGVCAGPLRIQAGFGSNPGGAGFLDAQGGDLDVKVVLGRSAHHQ